jgi:hypothetical protein
MARSRDLEKIGRKYREQHAGYAPDRLRPSRNKARRLALKAIDSGTGWICRLAQAGPDLQHGVIHLKHLGLEHLEPEGNLWDHAAVLEVKQAVRRVAPHAFYARLEAGEEARRVHVHILAHEPLTVHCALESVRDLEKMAAYLSKPPAPSDDLGIGEFQFAKLETKKQGRNLPRLAFWRGIPKA